MKAIQQNDTTQKLMGEIRLARLQLVKADSQLAEAKEQARLARQRRKAAKQAARHAKKLAKQAKEKVAVAKLALAELQARLARPDSTRVKRKFRRMTAKKVAVASRRKISVAPVAAQPQKTLNVRKPVARRTRFKRKLSPDGKAAKKSAAAPRGSETPIVLIPPAASKAAGQIVKSVKKIFTGEIATVTPAEPAVSESLSPPEENPVTPGQTSTNSTLNP